MPPADPNRHARLRVVEYYDHCWDDYRILWRTDENGSVHFGFFESQTESLGDRVRAIPAAIVAIAAAPAAGLAGTVSRRETANRWLRVAARGRAARHDAAQERMTAECAKAAALRPGELVLDAGCGVGGTGLWLARYCGVRVHGVNVQPRHLAEAQRNAARHPSGHRVRFSMQDFTRLAIADGSVDVVWGLESVCHSADKSAFVREAYRVLRPGGRVMVADFFLVHDDVPAAYGEAMRRWTEAWALPNLASIGGFTSLLSAHGFTALVSRDIGKHVVPSSRRLYKASLVARPINTLLERMGARSAIAGANVHAAFHQYRTLKAGVWTYAIMTATK